MSGTRLASRAVATADAGGEDRWWRSAIVAVCALSLALGTWTALRSGHTGDEAFSALLSEMPFDGWWEIISHQEMNGSVHAAILYLWAKTGDSDAWMRVPSIAAMVAALPVVMLLARRLTGSANVAVLTGLVLAVNPLAIRYSAEARGYSLFLLLSATSTLLLVRFVQRRRSADIIWWGVVTVVLLYTHLFTTLLLVAQGVVVLAHAERRSLIREGRRGAAVVAVGAVPAIAYFFANETSNIDWIDKPGPRDVLKLGRDLIAGSSWMLAGVVAVAVVAGVVSGWRAERREGERADHWTVVALVVLAAAGPVLAVVISQARPIVTVKYLMASLPAIAILAALGLARLRTVSRLVALGLIVALGVTTAASTHRPEPDRVVDVLATGGRPGDGVMFGRFSHRVQVERSVVTSGVVPAPSPVYPSGGWGDLDLVVARQPERATAVAEFVASGSPRLWLVSTPNEEGRRIRRSILRQLGVDPVESYRERGALIELLVLPGRATGS